MKKFVKVMCLALVLAMAVGCFAGCNGSSSYTANNTTFKIGVSGPLTGGGAVYGQAVKNSAQMAVDEINAAGGLDGVMFELVMMDDMHDPANVANNYAKLLEGGMQVSLGCVTTEPGLEFTNLSVEDNVFFLTPSASGDAIPAQPNGYQMCFADSNQGAAAVKQVNEAYAGQTIGAFYLSDDPYSKGIFDQFKANLDPSITLIETVFTSDTSTDFSAQIAQLKNCKFVFMPIYYDPAAIFMNQAKSVLPADAVYYGCDGFDGLTGVLDLSTIPQEVSMLSHFNSGATEGKAADFVAKYTDKYGTETLNQFGASAYDCVYAIYGAMKAAKEAGKDINVTMSASDLCEILKEQFNGGYTFSGCTGENITWETNGYVKKDAIKYVLKSADEE